MKDVGQTFSLTKKSVRQMPDLQIKYLTPSEKIKYLQRMEEVEPTG